MRTILFIFSIGVVLSVLPTLVGGVAAAGPPATDPTPTPAATFPPRQPVSPDADVSASSISSGSALDLAGAMGVPQSDIVSASLGSSDPSGVGISNTPLSHFPTQGQTFAILSSGLAASAGAPNNSGSLSYVLNGLSNEQGNDLVQLALTLKVPADKNCLSVDFAFYSEEYPEFVGSIYNDAFTIEYGLSQQSIVNSQLIAPWNFAFDTAGNIISINTVAGMEGNTGTTYDGGSPLLQARHPVQPETTVTLIFSIQDLGDSIYDSAVFLDNFRWLNETGCQAGSQPKPPLVLVHGWQGININPLTCDPANTTQNPAQAKLEILRLKDIQNVFKTNPSPEGALYALEYWAEMPGWLTADYDVWIAQFKTSLNRGTPHLAENGKCLRNQINYVYNTVNAGNPGKKQKVTIVAHSMGGLVSRACLAYQECSRKVDHLITLGSPHAGLSPASLAQVFLGIVDCAFAPGGCEMSESNMNRLFGFNHHHPNKHNIDYFFLGGWRHAPLWRDHDGLVGKFSSMGWGWPHKSFSPLGWSDDSPPQQYWTDEWHSRAYSLKNGQQIKNDYMRYRLVNGQVTTERSYAYQCLSQWLKHENISEFCENANGGGQTLAAQNQTIPQTTQFLSGNLGPGATQSAALPIDTNGASEIRLAWSQGALDFSLVRPDGQTIDPAYAAAHPAEVTYEFNPGNLDILPYAAYTFPSTGPGLWQLNITAGNVDPAGVNYVAYALLETNRILTAGSDRNHYNVGQTATITAALQHNGIGLPGATVTAKLTRSDGVVDTLTLTDQGNGAYTGGYIIPDAPGFLPIVINAVGTDSGALFTRRAELWPTIASNEVQLTGVYAIQPRNNNGDTLYESLDLLAQVTAAGPGDYTIFAALKANGQLVTQGAFDVAIEAGTQTVTLPFDGGAIRASQLNGPYLVTDISLVSKAAGVVAHSAANVLTTLAYQWQDFGGCYTLTTTVNPTKGGTITANPAPNCNGNTQYSVGSEIQLTAAPNSGLVFANWIVDASGNQNPLNFVISEDRLIAANFVAAGSSKVHLPVILK
jgi:hypothetical protein